MAKGSWTKSYVAELTTWAARFNIRPHLSKITLAHILSGDTCPPISLTDLEAYLTFKEHSIENLQFIVWFQDYRRRFFALSEIEKAYSPGPSASDFQTPSTPSRADIERRAFDSCTKLQACRGRCLVEHHLNALSPSHTPSSQPVNDGVAPLTPLTTFLPPFSPSSSIPSTPATPYTTRRISLVPLLSSPNPPSSTLISTGVAPSVNEAMNSNAFHASRGLDSEKKPLSQFGSHSESLCIHDKQPFRLECMRIVATFFQPGAPKELPLDEIVRDTVVRNLALNTHPDMFLSAYEEIYELVERTSLPRFLAFATTNINRPKQLFWYLCGLLHLMGSIAVALTIIMMVPDSPHGNRAWRLFSLPWAWFGSMQIYAAFRGFCNQVWSRNGIQLHSWELSEADEECKFFVDRVISEMPLTSPDEQTNHERHTRPTFQSNLHPHSRSHRSHTHSQTRSHSSIHSESTLHAHTTSSTYTHTDVSPPQLHQFDEPLTPYPVPPLDASSTFDSKTVSMVAPFLSASDHEDKIGAGKDQMGKKVSPTSESSTASLIRPPIFGPERVVQDPRIKAVHRQVMNAIWLVGLIYVVLFAAVVISVPSRRS